MLINIKKQVAPLNVPVDWDGKYSIIYADPPWQYKDSKRRGGAGKHYDLMSMTDLKELDIPSICKDDCVLFMWACYPMLQEALDLIKAWGFEYKTIGFQWIKTTAKGKIFFGTGTWTRANSECCLIGVKGNIKPIKNNMSQIIMSEIQGHSRKPAIVRDKIVELCGDLPRIELFARQKTSGWHVFGNEVTSDVNL